MQRSKRPRAAAAARDPELVSVTEAAAMLHRKPMTVRRLIRTRELDARIVFYRVMVVKESVERLLRPRPYKPQRPAPPPRTPSYGPAQPATGLAKGEGKP